jgi:hypothetical protein
VATHNEWNTVAPGNYWQATGNNISNTNSGNVGIGTGPASLNNYKLQVNGNAYVQGASLVLGGGISGGGLEVSSSDLVSQFIRMDGKNIQSMGNTSAFFNPIPKDLILNPFGANVQIGTATSVSATKLTFPNRLGNKITFWSSSPTSEFGIGLQNATLQFYTAGAERMVFGYGSSSSMTETMVFYPFSGQLGIGTYNQGAYKLAVNGSIHCSEVVVETGWADFVFDEKYHLPLLTNVEKFIKKNKRLPGIPTAAEIQKNGLPVGELQTKMMQKIEELTLYLIRQEKIIAGLQKKLNNKN